MSSVCREIPFVFFYSRGRNAELLLHIFTSIVDETFLVKHFWLGEMKMSIFMFPVCLYNHFVVDPRCYMFVLFIAFLIDIKFKSTCSMISSATCSLLEIVPEEEFHLNKVDEI